MALQSWTRLLDNLHCPSQQNYFQNNGFAERNPLPPVQCCFLQTARDQAFFEHTTTLLPGEGGEGRISTAMMFQKKIILPKYAIFSTVLFKIVAFHVGFLRVAIITRTKNFLFDLNIMAISVSLQYCWSWINSNICIFKKDCKKS